MNRDELHGKAKTSRAIQQGVGDLTGDQRLRGDGVTDEAEGMFRRVPGRRGGTAAEVGEAVRDRGEKTKL